MRFQAGTGATTTLLSVVLDRQGAESLAQQLYSSVRDLTLSGQLAPGARLPSSRKLADDLGVSRSVTLAAYDQLAAEGYVEARRGSGLYVRDLIKTPRIQVQPASPGRHAIHHPPVLRGRPFDPDVSSELFPLSVWARLMGSSWRKEGEAAAGTDQWAGMESLRAAIADYLRALQGLDCSAGQVVITAGNADSLQLITRALGAPGAQIWLEDPGHVGARRTLVREGLKITPIPVDQEGLNVTAGRRLAPHAQFALVTPSRQFPSGVPLSLSRRTALIDWARTSGALIIADEYDSELRFSGRPLASLWSLDTHDSVVSIGSFSKLTFPGLRIGYVVGAPALIARLVQVRMREGAPVATGAQPALAEFISGGGFARHLRNLRRQMTHRRETLCMALQKRLAGVVTILPQEVGLHVTISLANTAAPRLSDVEIAARAAARGLSLDPLSSHSIATPALRGFLLGYAAWEDAHLVAGVEELARLLEECDSAPVAT